MSQTTPSLRELLRQKLDDRSAGASDEFRHQLSHPDPEPSPEALEVRAVIRQAMADYCATCAAADAIAVAKRKELRS